MKHRMTAIACALLLTFAMLALAQDKKNPKPEQARDPVCGLMVDKNPELSASYKGQTYYFCLKTDRDKFRKNPQEYVK